MFCQKKEKRFYNGRLNIHQRSMFTDAAQQRSGTLHSFNRNVDADFMVKLYRKVLLKSVGSLYGTDLSEWILKKDNDPKHRSLFCAHWKEENDTITLDWLAQSSDANLNENVWALKKLKL